MHKISLLSFLIILISVLSQCKKDEPGSIGDCGADHCVNLSQLDHKKNYILPFILYNDIPADQLAHLTLNNEPFELLTGEQHEFEDGGFFELVIHYKSGQTDTKLFSTVSQERDHGEWGLAAWVPEMFETTTHQGEDIEALYPRRFIEGMEVPFIFYLTEGNRRKAVYLDARHNTSGKTFYIKRGVGSALLRSPELASGSAEFTIGGTGVDYTLTSVESPGTILNDDITSETVIPANSTVLIENDLSIAESGSLTIEEGVIILIAEKVNITHAGPITFNGSKNNPIVVTCHTPGKYWGGFISDGAASAIQGNYAIFCRSGYHDTQEYQWGHANRQALFYTENSSLTLKHCYMIDHIGQIFYPRHSTLDFQNILVQRAKTGGQLNDSKAMITNSVFTDFPDDSLFYVDHDNDALYINASDVIIDSCLFMFAKDDGIDSGGSEGGQVIISNTRFEACFHEGAALSSSGEVNKTHTFEQCIFVNCGQGLELGYSSPNHEVFANNCQFLNNYIGIRYGDNYEWSNVNGTMNISNSKSLYNERDVWNMVRSEWAPKLDKMTFNNVQVSENSQQYPDLEVIQ